MNIDTILQFCKDNVWLCTIITTILAILTFVINFIIKKNKGTSNTQTISNVTSSQINQAGGNINTNKNV